MGPGSVSTHLFYDLWDSLDTKEREFQLSFLLWSIVSAQYFNVLLCYGCSICREKGIFIH